MKLDLIATALLLSSSSPAADAEHADLPAWMAGAWERVGRNAGDSGDSGETWAEEYWIAPRAGVMLGASRSGQGEKLAFWEQMRIVREADGAIVFWAVAGDQKPVRFKASAVRPEEIIFENPAHDYPQRIRYWRKGKQLNAEISLLDGGKRVVFQFALVSPQPRQR